MHFRKARKLNRIETCHVSSIALQQLRQNISTFTVACGAWWTRVTAGDNPELGEWRRAGEVFVRVDVNVCRMIDCDEAHLIEIDKFLHHLGKPKAQAAIAGLHMTAFDAKVLCRIWSIRLARGNPMADDAWTDHIGDEFVVFTVPNPHDWARTATPVDFTKEVTPARCKLNLILHDAGRPQEPHDVGFHCLIHARDDFPRILSQISGR